MLLWGALLLSVLATLPLWLPATATACLAQQRLHWPRRPRLFLLALLAILLLATGGLYHRLGAAADVRLAASLQQIDALPADRQLAAWTALSGAFRARLAQRPDNTGYRRLLAEDAALREDWPEAAQHYSHLARLAGGNPELEALALTARFMADGRRISAALQADMEALLAMAPEQSAVRGMLGMQAFEQGAYAQAIEHWQWALRGLAAGDPVADSLRAGIQRARQMLDAAAAPAWLHVRLTVEGAAGHAPETPVFVFVRRAGGGMPVAARRLQLGDLPLTVSLGPADALQGADLRQAGQVQVAVRLALAGAVQAGADDPEVHSDWFEGASPPEALQIALRLPATRP